MSKIINRESVDQFSDAVYNASDMARKEFANIWAVLDKSDPYAVRDALLDIVPAIVEKYGSMSALAASEFYEQRRMEDIGGNYQAFLAEMEQEKLEASIRWACGFMWGGEEYGRKRKSGGIELERPTSFFGWDD